MNWVTNNIIFLSVITSEMLLPKYYAKRHIMLKFNEIFNCKISKTMNNLNRFINIVINSCKT